MERKYIYMSDVDIYFYVNKYALGKEKAIFQTIRNQIEAGICYTSLTDAVNTANNGKDAIFICSSLPLYNINRRYSSAEFVQLEYDRATYEDKGEAKKARIVMGMSTGKMLASPLDIHRLTANSLDVWGRLRIIKRDEEIFSFVVKPFVVGVEWISSIFQEDSL